MKNQRQRKLETTMKIGSNNENQKQRGKLETRMKIRNKNENQKQE